MSPSSRTVVHVLGELRASGAEVMLRASAPMWREADVDVAILATGTSPGPYAGDLAAAGFAIRHLPVHGPTELWAVHRYLREVRPAALHVHTERAAFWYAALARTLPVPRVVRTVHSVFDFRGALRLERTAQRALARSLGVQHIAISPQVASNELERFRNRCTLVPNWVDTRRFRPATDDARRLARQDLDIAPETIVVTSVGNCAPAKNHPALIEALAALPRDVEWCYLHAGVGDGREADLADRLGIRHRCRFLGLVTDVPSLLRASDVYVMPSTYEGLGNAALEALATGTPAILSDVGGLRAVAALAPNGAVRLVRPRADAVRAALCDVIRGDQPRPDPHACHAAVEQRHSMRAGVDAYMGTYGLGPSRPG